MCTRTVGGPQARHKSKYWFKSSPLKSLGCSFQRLACKNKGIFYMQHFWALTSRATFQGEHIFAPYKRYEIFWACGSLGKRPQNVFSLVNIKVTWFPSGQYNTALLPVLEPELICFTVTTSQLNKRDSPNSVPPLEAKSPNLGLQGLTPLAWIIRVDQPPLYKDP